MSESAKALTSLRGVHLRTLEQLKHTVAELDELKAKLGGRGSYVDEEECQRIKDAARKECDQKLSAMQKQLEAAMASVHNLEEEKKQFVEKISTLKAGQETAAKNLETANELLLAQLKKLEEENAQMKISHEEEIKISCENFEKVRTEKKALSGKIKSLEASENKLQKENERLGDVIESLTVKLRKLQEANGKDSKQLEKRNKELEQALRAAKSRIGTLETDYADVKGNLEKAASRVETLEEKLKKAEESAKTAQKSLARAREDCLAL